MRLSELLPPGVIRRRSLWIGFLAVLIPLVVLLTLQYRWLVDLEQKSGLASRAAMSNFLDGIANKIEYTYRSEAERMLNVPPSLLTENKFGKIAYHFKKKQGRGKYAAHKALFIFDFSTEEYEDMGLYLYDPETHSMIRQSEDKALQRAATAASSPWWVFYLEQSPYESAALVVDERDPRNRVILNPIIDDEGIVQGVAGMVLDEGYFRDTVLEKAWRKSVPACETGSDEEELLFTVRDSDDRIALSNGRVEQGVESDQGVESEEHVRRTIPFVFTDWTLGLSGLYSSPEQLAQTTFAFNMTLSILLALFLISGIIIALRAASREMYVSRMKSDFVSNVSHELRTPLSSIRVFGEFLRLGRVGEGAKVQEYGEYIESESRRLTQLINNILDFSKIESGQKLYHFEQADLAKIVRDTIKMFEVRLKHSGFQLSFESDDDLPPAAVDAAAVGQAFNNLIDNAVKYSGESKQIHVRLAREGRYAVLSVQDFGIGIRESEQDKIFDRFHRVSTGLVHDVKGSGLGLSIVNHIAKAHQGEVKVDSEPGRGSTFALRLPISREEAPAPDAEPSRQPAIARAGSE